MRFDTSKWAAGRGIADAENPRIFMVGQAERAGLREGATRAQVRALLGEPDISDEAGDIWFLGRSTVAPDYETLHVDYDESGTVTKVSTRNS